MNYFKLNSQNLSSISEQITKPSYNRQKVKAGIVHVGVGGFHRAHQAYYTDQLLHDTSITDWGICGVGLLAFDKKIIDTLKAQDGLYTLVVKELDGTLSKTIIGSITEYLFAPANPMAVIEKMAHRDTKIITLTITEGGYNYNEATNSFDFDNPTIQHDLQNPTAPKTIFGYLTQALKLRRDRNRQGCTIQSCDNIQENGHFAKRMILSYVNKAAPELLTWIESNVSFPNSMVDRITPVTSPSDIAALRANDGLEDQWPVVCEPFKQWVIEDDFVAGRPPWEEVGAQFVKNVAPYEEMKLSLLNAGHSVLGILGALMGYDTIDESLSNPSIHTFLSNFLDKEVTPVLGDIAGVNLEAYKHSLLQRFGNLYIRDQIDRICSESSAKIPIFILPTVSKQLKQNDPMIEHAAFVIAAWAIYSLGKDEKGKQLTIKDARKEVLHAKAILAVNKPKLFLEIEAVFGQLNTSTLFVDAFENAYQNILKQGVEKCVIELNRRVLDY